MNPAAMFKIMQAKNTFTKNHPKFEAFLKNVMANKIVEGTVIEVSIQRPRRRSNYNKYPCAAVRS